MGQQSNKTIKRRRRANYLQRKKDQAKLGGITKKSPAVKKSSASVSTDAAKKAPAKKAAAPAKKAAKKAPAKKAAADAAAAEVADKTVDAVEEIEANAPAPADESEA